MSDVVDVGACRKMLQARRAELLKTMTNRDDIQIERVADAIDDGQYAAGRDVAVIQLDWYAQRLREIDTALERLTQGSFRTCQNCGERISRKRLSAVPWTALCLECQAQEDQRNDGGREELRLRYWTNAD